MSLNQLLKDEQLTIMQNASATRPADASRHRRKLNMFARLLEAHPYPHRPYSPPNGAEAGLSAGEHGPAPELARWENEGGAI